MKNQFVARKTIAINAPISKVWNALTDPAQIKVYLFGTDVHTDWKKGSPITYTGVWNGKPYEDKGMIVDIIPEKLYHSTYYSPMSGLEDKPENYNNVTWELSEQNGITHVSLTQDNIATDESRQHSENNWEMVLNGMKNLLEK
jgi:uncharacterized protein YndB with AHSA1/START domain